MRFRVLSLDAYGTILAGGSDAFVRLVRDLARETGADADGLLRLREEAIRRLQERGYVRIRERDRAILRDLYASLGVDRDVEADLDALAVAYREVDVYPDARRLLARLDVPWGVSSNTDRAVMEEILAEHGLEPAFLVTSEDAQRYKPDAGFFAAVARAAGCAPADVLHAGDSWVADVEGAKAAGMAAAWVRRPGGLPRPRTTSVDADAEVDDLEAILPLVRGP